VRRGAIAIAVVAATPVGAAHAQGAATSVEVPPPPIEVDWSARPAPPPPPRPAGPRRWFLLTEAAGSIRWLDRVPLYGGAFALAAGARRRWGGAFGGVEGFVGESPHRMPSWSADAFARIESPAEHGVRGGAVLGLGALGFGRLTRRPPLWAPSANAAVFLAVDLVRSDRGSLFVEASLRGDLAIWSASGGPSLGLGATF
jgi:hypothetical protein